MHVAQNTAEAGLLAMHCGRDARFDKLWIELWLFKFPLVL